MNVPIRQSPIGMTEQGVESGSLIFVIGAGGGERRETAVHPISVQGALGCLSFFLADGDLFGREALPFSGWFVGGCDRFCHGGNEKKFLLTKYC